MSTHLENPVDNLEKMSNEKLVQELILMVTIDASYSFVVESIRRDIHRLSNEILRRLNMATANNVQIGLSLCEIDKEFLKG